jgi:hydroxypyruvate isomerase
MIKLGCNAMLRVSEKLPIAVKEDPRNWMDIEDLIDAAADMGLDIVDFHLYRGFLSSDRDYLRGIKKRCLDCGLPIGYLGVGRGFIAVGKGTDGRKVAVALPEEERQRRVEEARQAIDLAEFMSTPLVRFFAGAVPEGSIEPERLWAGMVATFQEVADYAAEKGVFIGLHNHPPAVAPAGDDIIRLLSDVDRENVTFILDTGRWRKSSGAASTGSGAVPEEFYGFMEQTAPYAMYVRAKIYKIDSGREEWIDYERVVDILRGVGFNGNMSIVYEGKGNACSDLDGIALAARYLRGLLAER